MLVLTRKIGEEVLIGDAIRVRVLEVQGNRVKLGFVAPDEVRFKRGELPIPRAPKPGRREPTDSTSVGLVARLADRVRGASRRSRNSRCPLTSGRAEN